MVHVGGGTACGTSSRAACGPASRACMHARAVGACANGGPATCGGSRDRTCAVPPVGACADRNSFSHLRPSFAALADRDAYAAASLTRLGGERLESTAPQSASSNVAG